MNYYDLINGINNGTIKKITFSVVDYAHYRKCSIEVKSTDPSNPESGRIIYFYLTPDGYEKKGFMNTIKEDSKLFYIKGKGSFTLKQMWNKINIYSIEYS